MSLLDKNGEPVTGVQFNLKKESANHLADRKALHNGQGSTKPFKSMEDLEKTANDIYAKATNNIAEEYEKDKASGLDINDLNSVMSFETGYTPIGESILVKFIKEEQKIGSLILPDSLTNKDNKKAVVITPGLLISSVFKGDVVMLKGTDRNNPFPPSFKRLIKGITFEEIPYDAVAGVFDNRESRLEKIRKNGN